MQAVKVTLEHGLVRAPAREHQDRIKSVLRAYTNGMLPASLSVEVEAAASSLFRR